MKTLTNIPKIELQFVNINENVDNAGVRGTGVIIMRDCNVTSNGGFIVDPVCDINFYGDFYIERNTFSTTTDNTSSLKAFCGNSYVIKNVFINTSIEVSSNSSFERVVKNNVLLGDSFIFTQTGGDVDEFLLIEHNSFLNNNNTVLRLYNSGASMTARNNYWNTTDFYIINSMIYDANDDYFLKNYIEYLPILTEPHPDTTVPNFNQPPIAECGTGIEVVFDVVNLDGSASYDLDGSIGLYEWKLEYRGDSSHDQSATGVNPTVPDLYKGAYDVYLTVTDNGGAKGIDSFILTAAGACPNTPFPDSDEDGEHDLTDLCPDTPADTMVDSDGCSLAEFCNAIDTSTNHGRKICKQSDWRNDEPLKNQGDCKAVKQGKGSSNYSCVPR